MKPSLTRNSRKTKLPRAMLPRSGFTILEMIVALILLGTVMAIVVPALGWMGVQNRLSLQKQEAIQGLNNLLEDLTARPYAKLTPELAKSLTLPDTLKAQLPGAALEVEIAEVEPAAKRIRARLSWNQRNGKPLAPIRLTAWVYPQEAQP